MQPHTRRSFVLHLVAGTSAAATPALVLAEDKLTETDAYARSMGFRLDTSKVDKVKYPRHDAATQQCAKCQLFDGKPTDAEGPCSFYGGRLVPSGGWCRNFKVRKA